MTDEMAAGGGKLASPDWTAIRDAWRAGGTTQAALAKRFGVSVPALRKRARLEAWQPGAARATPAHRLRAMLLDRLDRLERAKTEEPLDERAARMMSQLARTLETVLDLERKERVAERSGSSGSRLLDDARRCELARRLEAIAGPEECPDPGGGTRRRSG